MDNDTPKSFGREELIFNYGVPENGSSDGKNDRVDLEIILFGSSNSQKNTKSIASSDSYLSEFDPYAPQRRDDGPESSDLIDPVEKDDSGATSKEQTLKPSSKKSDASSRLLKRLERKYKRNKIPGEKNLSVDYMDYF